MKTEIFRASSRGHFDHGWLDTYHTFSFANYYDPNRVHFGELRVLNDDVVQGGEGFGTHSHDNMEIISMPLYGDLEHKDSMGSHGVIHCGEVQVMSAGTGITHSEFNANAERPVNFFQIWIFPREQNVTPRYGSKKFDFFSEKNKLIQIVSPDQKEGELWIHQDAWLSTGIFEQGKKLKYAMKKRGDGLFLMNIDGELKVGDQTLYARDGMAIYDTDTVEIEAVSEEARLLLIEIPM